MTDVFYKYCYRLGFGSDKMLIEIQQGAKQESFLQDFLRAINSIQPTLKDIIELWQNDEVLYEINSTVRSFILSKDVWGFAFILSDNNQKGLSVINNLLSANASFFQVNTSIFLK